jgi:hypothetical protein
MKISDWRIIDDERGFILIGRAFEGILLHTYRVDTEDVPKAIVGASMRVYALPSGKPITVTLGERYA